MELISFRDGAKLEIEAGSQPSNPPARVELSDGHSISVRTLRLPAGADSEVVWSELQRLGDVSARHLARPVAARLDEGSVTVADEEVDGPSLRVLQRLVPFTLEQAAMVGDGLLAAVAELEAHGAHHRHIGPDTAFIGAADGLVRLAAPDPRPDAADASSDLKAAVSLVRQLMEAAASAGHRSTPPATTTAFFELLQAEDATSRPAAALSRRWHRHLREQLGGARSAKVRRQLQALAARLADQRLAAASLAAAPREAAGAEGPSGESVAPAAVATAAAVRAASRPPGRALGTASALVERPAPPLGNHADTPPGRSQIVRAAPPSRSPWTGLLAAAVVLLLVLAGGTFLALRATAGHHVGGGPGTARPTPARSQAVLPSPTQLPSPAASPTPSLAPTPTPLQLQEIPLLGPASNPPVSNVELAGSCPASGSGSCTFTVTANLSSHPAATVAWRLDLVNRCTGAVSQVASGQIPAPSYYTYVEAQPQVSIPSTTPVGLVALAGAPGLAASAPLLITPPGSSCPG